MMSQPHHPEPVHDDDDVETVDRADMARRRWGVFILVLLGTAALTGLGWFIAGLPGCENPPNDWMPCWA